MCVWNYSQEDVVRAFGGYSAKPTWAAGSGTRDRYEDASLKRTGKAPFTLDVRIEKDCFNMNGTVCMISICQSTSLKRDQVVLYNADRRKSRKRLQARSKSETKDLGSTLNSSCRSPVSSVLWYFSSEQV